MPDPVVPVPPAPPVERKRFWEFIFLYPTLLLALVGAVPTVIQEVKAWRLGVTSKRVQIVEAQQALWQKNLDCLSLKPVYTVNLGDGAEVGVTLCGSGDALLRYQRSPEAVSYTWTPYPDYPRAAEQQHSAVGDVPVPESRVVYGLTRCVLLQGIMVLWIQYDHDASEMCHIDYIATISGVLVQRRPVACQVCAG